MEIGLCQPLEPVACTGDLGLRWTLSWSPHTWDWLNASSDNILSSSRFYFHQGGLPEDDCTDLAEDESCISDGPGKECSCDQQDVDRAEVEVHGLFSGVELVSYPELEIIQSLEMPQSCEVSLESGSCALVFRDFRPLELLRCRSDKIPGNVLELNFTIMSNSLQIKKNQMMESCL